MQRQGRNSGSGGQEKRGADAGVSGSGTARVIKRRAPTACQGCRARKVRCDVLEYGPPCTNCRLDEQHCTVSMGKRRLRFASSNAETILEGFIPARRRPRRTEVELTDVSEEEPHAWFNRNGARPQFSWDTQSAYSHHKPVSLNAGHQPHLIYHNVNSAPVTISPQDSGPLPGIVERVGESSAAGQQERSLSPTARAPPQLPLWVKPLPVRIEAEDVAFLTKKGALTIPANPLRDELLGCFIEWVYPWTPMLDVTQLLRIISRGDGSCGKLSLFCLQAIMFSAVGFVDLGMLQQAGYQTHKDAKKHFFRKTKLLYDFEYEDDRISLIQGLLLMTYWHESPDDQKDIWHWLGIATSLAQTIGLHRDPGSLSMEPIQKHLRKRVWWSLYMRDRLVALAMRRSPRIQQKDCDVPLLKLEDFDIQALGDDITCLPPTRCTFVYHEPSLRRLARLCCQVTKLCVTISHVLEVQYAIVRVEQDASSETDNTRTTMVLLPRKNLPSQSELDFCDMELADWIARLPEDITYRATDIDDSGNHFQTLLLHRAVLSMLYYTAVNLLHRPRFLSSRARAETSRGRRSCSTTISSASLASPLPCDSALEKTRTAAQMVTQTAVKLLSLNLIKYLPTVAVTAIVHAAIMHLVDVRSPDEALRHSSVRELSQSMAILEQLRGLYIAADYACFLLHQGIQKAGLGISWSQAPRSSAAPIQDAVIPSPFSDSPSNQCDLPTMLCNGCDSPSHRHGHPQSSQSFSPTFEAPQSVAAAQPFNPMFTTANLTMLAYYQTINGSTEDGMGNTQDVDQDANFTFESDRIQMEAESSGGAYTGRALPLTDMDFGPYEDDLALFDTSNDFGWRLDWLTPLGGAM